MIHHPPWLHECSNAILFILPISPSSLIAKYTNICAICLSHTYLNLSEISIWERRVKYANHPGPIAASSTSVSNSSKTVCSVQGPLIYQIILHHLYTILGMSMEIILLSISIENMLYE